MGVHQSKYTLQEMEHQPGKSGFKDDLFMWEHPYIVYSLNIATALEIYSFFIYSEYSILINTEKTLATMLLANYLTLLGVNSVLL